MPDQCLDHLCVRSDRRRIDHGHEDYRVAYLRGVTAIASDDPEDPCANRFCMVERVNKVCADVVLEAAAAHGENKDAVIDAEATDLEPLHENRRPSVVIGARGQLGYV